MEVFTSLLETALNEPTLLHFVFTFLPDMQQLTKNLIVELLCHAMKSVFNKCH